MTQSDDLLSIRRNLEANPSRADRQSSSPLQTHLNPETSLTMPDIPQIQNNMDTWEECAVEEGKYIAGDSWTMVDSAFWPVLNKIMSDCQGFGEKERPALVVYHQRVLMREGVRDILGVEK